MRRTQHLSSAILAAILLPCSQGNAQAPLEAAPPGRSDGATWKGGEFSPANGRFPRITGNYQPRFVPPLELGNSGRMEQLLRGGNLYLSLDDAIALALENNIDIEIQRYGTPIANANLLRAQAGGALRGVTPSVVSGPGSATAISNGSGTTGSSFTSTGVQSSASTQTSSSGSSQGALIQQTGTAIPNLDPYIQGTAKFAHTSTPQSSTLVTGTPALVNDQDSGQVTLNQSFLTGTTYSVGYADIWSKTNSVNNLINPSRTASTGFS